MRELDKERITELGSTLAKKTREGHTRSRLQSGAGDLLSSTKIPLGAASHQDKDYGECGAVRAPLAVLS